MKGWSVGWFDLHAQHVAAPHWDTRFDEQRNVVEEVTGVPLCVPAQPSGSPGATLELSTAQSSVSPAALAICQGNLDFTTCLELLVNNFSIPFVASFENDPAIRFGGLLLSGCLCFRQRLPRWHISPYRTVFRHLRFLNAFMQLQFPGGTWSSLCVSHNVRTRLHIDARNKPASQNHTLSLGNFSGGEVWMCPAPDAKAPLTQALHDSTSAAHPWKLHAWAQPWTRGTPDFLRLRKCSLHSTSGRQMGSYVLDMPGPRSIPLSQLAH